MLTLRHVVRAEGAHSPSTAARRRSWRYYANSIAHLLAAAQAS
jgi:hypothetical protein